MSLSFEKQLRDDVFKAYFDARKNKRNTKAQLAFEINAEHNIMELYRELLERTYEPGTSMCFITHRPVIREVFASQFRDRVVHHLLYNYIAPIFEKGFIYDSYSCRKGRGTLFGIKRLDHHIRSCTNNYTQPAYVLKLDVQGYFMNIDKHLLYDIVNKTMKKHWEKHGVDHRVPARNDEFIDFLIRSVIFKDPTRDCVIRGSGKEWKLLPVSKSLLLKKNKDIGLPIGDLTSQLFSNIYLGELDNYVKRVLKEKHYGRYVDDFYIVHPSKQHLKEQIPKIEEFLVETLHLHLHPKKVYLQPYQHGVAFLGAFVKPHRIYVVPRCLKLMRRSIRLLDEKMALDEMPLPWVYDIRATLNSYCGYFSFFRAYLILQRVFRNSLVFNHFYFSSGYGKSIPYKRYERRRYQRYKER